MLGDKATTTVAEMRESVPWVSLFSPFPFHSVYCVEDHRKHVDWIRTINPEALVSVKVSMPTDVEPLPGRIEDVMKEKAFAHGVGLCRFQYDPRFLEPLDFFLGIDRAGAKRPWDLAFVCPDEKDVVESQSAERFQFHTRYAAARGRA